MKYKVVVEMNGKKFIKKRSKSKDHLMQYAESLSKKHPRWKVFVVQEDTTV